MLMTFLPIFSQVKRKVVKKTLLRFISSGISLAEEIALFLKGFFSSGIYRAFRVACFVLIIFNISVCYGAHENTRVLILPFNVKGQNESSHVIKGITDMLTFRLSRNGAVEVISVLTDSDLHKQKTADTQSALETAKLKHADVVIFGSVEFENSRVKYDIRCMKPEKGGVLIAYDMDDAPEDAFVYKIDALARDIEESLHKDVSENPQPFENETPQKKADTICSTESPGVGSAGSYFKESNYESKAPHIMRTSVNKPQQWQSRSFKTGIVGIAVSDIDGDGKNELIYADSNSIHILKFRDGKLIELNTVEGHEFRKIVSIDASDINGNGKAEIFVTAFSDRKSFRSYVLEYNGNAYTMLADNQNWFFMVFNSNGKERKLFAQKMGEQFSTGETVYGADKHKIVMTGVYELSWTGDGYAPVKRLYLPENTVILGFAYGDLTGDGNDETVFYAKDNHLTVQNTKGDILWRSADPYGKSFKYIDYSDPDAPDPKKRLYLPVRIHFTDFDRNGNKEIITLKNDNDSMGYLAKLGIISKGYGECLAWCNQALTQVWKTGDYSGIVSDSVIADLNNDGIPELILVVVNETDVLFGNMKSMITVFSK